MSSELGCSVFHSSPGWVDMGGWNASSLWTDPDQNRQRETLMMRVKQAVMVVRGGSSDSQYWTV